MITNPDNRHLINHANIEGIYYSWLLRNGNPDVAMITGGGEIYFEYCGRTSEKLDRKLLVYITGTLLAALINEQLDILTHE